MNGDASFHPPFRLRRWLVQPDLNRISDGETVHQIEPRVMQVLLALRAGPGEVVSRNSLLDEIWGEAVVGEEILTRAVSELRRVFGDDARRPKYIETIRQHGYRLIAPVEDATEPKKPAVALEPPKSPAPADVSARPGRRPVLWFLVIIIPAVIWFFFLREESAPPVTVVTGASTQAVPLTSYPGREYHPALSADGSRVAFAWSGPQGDAPGIYVKQRNSETPLRLTSEPGWTAWPTFSPDGQTVAFVLGSNQGATICTVPSLGGAVSRLHEVPDLIEGIDWAADGKSLVFSARSASEQGYRIYQLELEGLTVDEQVPGGGIGDFHPRYSPDGRRLAWIRAEPDGGSVLMVAGESPRQVLRGLGRLQGLAWLPDGSGLVFAAAPAGKFSLWTVDLADGETRQVPTPGDFAWNPTLARETGDLAYEQVNVIQDLWAVRIKTLEPRQLETGPFIASTRWEFEADLSPDGRKVAFISDRSGPPELWGANEQGHDLKRLTDLAAAALNHPRWSPDGKSIAFQAVLEGTGQVFIISSRGGQPRAVMEGQVLLSGWTRDGKALLVGQDLGKGWFVHRIDPQNGAGPPLTAVHSISAAESEPDDPRGPGLYFTQPGQAGLWWMAKPGSGGLPRDLVMRIIPDLAPEDRSSWRLLPGSVAWILRSAGGAMLMSYDLAADISLPVTDLPGLAGSGLAIGPSGMPVLYPRTGNFAGDLMLVEGYFR